MKFSKIINKEMNNGYFNNQQEMDEILLKLELKHMGKNISLKKVLKKNF